MKIYPKYLFTIDSPLSASEMVSVLESAVEPPKLVRWGASGSRSYQGEFTHSGFKIWRIISYRNSFLPIIEGTIIPVTSGSRVAVTMRLHRFIAVFMIIWLSMVAALLLAFSLASMNGRIDPFPAVLVPFFMLVFGILLTSCSFWAEARKAKLFLVELFKGIEHKTTPE